MRLIDDNTVRFSKGNKNFQCQIQRDPTYGYFVHNVRCLDDMDMKCNNDYFLVINGYKDKQEQATLYKKLIGYFISDREIYGYWPWCKTKEDVIRVLRYLSEENEDKNFLSLYCFL